MNTEAKRTEREQILDALAVWINQRPGLQFGNYGDVKSYRAELPSITKDLHDARQLLAAVWWRDSITAEKLKAAFKRAFSGRVSWEQHPAKPLELQPTNYYRLEYCTGQYWPTEYRAAACAVLTSALWDYFRSNMPDPDTNKPSRAELAGEEFCNQPPRYNGMSAGDYIRATARKEIGRAIAARWFN